MNWDELKKPRRSTRGPDAPPPISLPQIKLPFKLPGIWVLIVIALIIWALSGIYLVRPDQKGVVLRFGRINRVTDPGPHYHLPAPFETVHKPKVTEVKRVEVGFRTIFQGPPARYQDRPTESLMLTGDENIVEVDVIGQYRISDPAKFLFAVKDSEGTVHNALEAAIREVIGSRGIDEALTTGKERIEEDTRLLVQAMLDRYNSGLQMVVVKLQDVVPPNEVIASFVDVASAREDRDRLINEAEGYENSVIPETRGEVAEILNLAAAYRAEKVLIAQGDAQRFKNILEEYVKAKDVTRKRLYLETMEQILPGIEKFILPEQGGGVLPILPLGRGAAPPLLGGN
jgi:membrane protease subunit HflK